MYFTTEIGDDGKEFQKYHPAKTEMSNKQFFFWEDECDVAAIPPRQLLYGKHLLVGAVSATVADGGVGKSITLLTEAIALVTQRALLGITPAPYKYPWGELAQPNVLYYNAEESLDEIKRRVCAICQHFKIEMGDLFGLPEPELGGLTVLSGHDFPLVIANAGNGGVEFNEDLLHDLELSNYGVVILDPLVSIHRVPENVNDAIDPIVKRLGMIATKTNKAIHLVHHAKKSNGEITGADARGASALRNGVRALRFGNRMTEAEGQRFNVDDHRRYFRFDHDPKGNYSAATVPTEWYEHKSVLLPNGDDVGVVVRWKPPAVTDRVTPTHMQQICDLVRGNEYRADPRATEMWIGNVVAEVLGMDIENDVDCETVKDLLDIKWFEDGVLRTTLTWSKKNRNRIVVVAVSDKAPGGPKLVKLKDKKGSTENVQR